jgi:L-threonylcarbamoyladenylate synthase
MTTHLPQSILDAINLDLPIIYPTSTLPGLGCKLNAHALDNLFLLKKRDENEIVSVAVANISQAKKLVYISQNVENFINAFPKGSLSIILPAKKTLDQRLGGDNIAIRIVTHPVAQKLLEKVGPLTATSANISGIKCLDNPISAACSLNIENGRVLEGKCSGGKPSTLVKLKFLNNNHNDEITAMVMREGVVPIHSVMEWTMAKN